MNRELQEHSARVEALLEEFRAAGDERAGGRARRGTSAPIGALVDRGHANAPILSGARIVTELWIDRVAVVGRPWKASSYVASIGFDGPGRTRRHPPGDPPP